MDDDAFVMAHRTDPAGTPIGVALQAREEDLVKLGVGVRFAGWNADSKEFWANNNIPKYKSKGLWIPRTLEFGLDFDVVLGEDYEAYIGSAKLLHRF